MSILHLAVREILHRKLSFTIALILVLLAGAVLTAEVGLLRRHDRNSEVITNPSDTLFPKVSDLIPVPPPADPGIRAKISAGPREGKAAGGPSGVFWLPTVDDADLGVCGSAQVPVLQTW